MYHRRTSFRTTAWFCGVTLALGLTVLAGCASKDKASTTAEATSSESAGANGQPGRAAGNPKEAATGETRKTDGGATAFPGAPALKPGEERWHGLIDLGMKKIEVVVDLTPGISDWQASLGLPGTKQYGIPLSDVSYDDKRLAFTLQKPANPEATETYVLDREGPIAGSGTMTIKGQSFPWSATKVTATGRMKPLLQRPQTPKAPFPYTVEALTVTNSDDGTKRAGELMLPAPGKPDANGARHPVVIIESGSGPQDRDGTFSGHKSYLVIADHLARRGIATFRTDDRGVGGSTGVDSDADHQTLAKDVLAMVAALKKHPRIDPKHIGVLGHSQGATVAPLAATMSSDVAFVVMLAGIGVPGDRVMMDQKRLILTSHGMPAEQLAKSLKAQRAMLDAILADAPEETLRSAVAASIAADLPPAQLALLTPKRQKAIIDGGVKSLQAGFLRALVKSKPASYLSKVKVPTLAIWGARDLQVEPQSNAAGVRAAFESSGNAQRLEVKIIDDMSHNLQETKTGKVEELATIEESVRPVLLDALSDWIRRTTGLTDTAGPE